MSSPLLHIFDITQYLLAIIRIICELAMTDGLSISVDVSYKYVVQITKISEMPRILWPNLLTFVKYLAVCGNPG